MFTIKNYSGGLASAVLALSDVEMGEGYLTENHFSAPNALAHVIMSSDDSFVGFGLSYLETPAELEERDPLVASMLRDWQLDSLQKIGTLKALAINEKFRGQGAGRILFEFRLGLLLGRGADIVLTTAWVTPDGIHISGMLEDHGFEALVSIVNYYQDGSLERGYGCPVCPGHPCTCSSTLFAKV